VVTQKVAHSYVSSQQPAVAHNASAGNVPGPPVHVDATEA
jgi:hypothetical protein